MSLIPFHGMAYPIIIVLALDCEQYGIVHPISKHFHSVAD